MDNEDRMTMVDRQINLAALDLSPGLRFVVRSPLVVMKSLGRQKFVTLDRQTTGHIVESYGDHGRPGLLMIRTSDELFLVWKRDLEERAELLPACA